LQGSPAEARIAAARRLIDRRRYREALDVINDAIRIDPGKSDSFHLRALVFEYLGMFPQAEADRVRAAEMGFIPEPEPEPVAPRGRSVVAMPPEEPDEESTEALDDMSEEPFIDDEVAGAATTDEIADEVASIEGEEEEPTADSKKAPRVAPVPRYAQRPPSKGEQSGAAVARGLGTVLVGVGLVAAFAVGIYLALASISDALDGGDGDGGGGATETPIASEGVSPSATADAPDDALSGSPLDFAALEAGWESKDITATPGDVNGDITGFGPTPVNVTLSRGGEEMAVAVLLYESAQGIGQDWDLGDRPTPKAGRSIPADSTVWYNLNAVVVVLESNDALRQDALDGFLAVNA